MEQHDQRRHQRGQPGIAAEDQRDDKPQQGPGHSGGHRDDANPQQRGRALAADKAKEHGGDMAQRHGDTTGQGDPLIRHRQRFDHRPRQSREQQHGQHPLEGIDGQHGQPESLAPGA